MVAVEPEPRYGRETRYKGYRFRSRLEARWALFFDALGVRYRYEPEAFDLGHGLRYVPDFWLPEQGLWVEVKGDYDAYEQQRTQDKAQRLVERTRHDLAMLVGDIWVPGEDGAGVYPGHDAHYIYRYFGNSEGGEGPAVGWDNYHYWCECPACGEIGFEFSGRAERVGCPCFNGWHEKFSCEDTPRLQAAYEQARGWRFDRTDTSLVVVGPNAAQQSRRAFRERHDLSAVLGSATALQGLDGLLVGSCPLCKDQGWYARYNAPPYLRVDPARQSWTCMACGYGGDVLRFVELHERAQRGESLLCCRGTPPGQQRAQDATDAAERV